MYRKQKRIPTILALLLIVAGLGSAVYLERTTQLITSSASSSSAPEMIRVTNLSDTYFTVSWFTANPETGAVLLTDGNSQTTHVDDRDTDLIPRARTTHHITLRGLKESTDYRISIVSGKQTCSSNNNCTQLTQKTLTRISTPLNLPPIHGSVISKDNKPSEGSVVYVTIGKNFPLSTQTDSAGIWVIPLTNLRSENLESPPLLSDSDIIQISVISSPSVSASAVTSMNNVRNNEAIPPIILGGNYNFIEVMEKLPDLALGEGKSQVLGESQSPAGQKNNQSSIDLLFPKTEQDTTSDSRPRLRGTGTPGSTLLITVNSVPQTGRVTVANDGTWYFRPANNLPPGVHTLTVQWNDKNGNVTSISRQFIVLKSGESVLGDATPSASLTPTVPPSPTPTVLLIPSPTTIVASPTSTVPTATPNQTPPTGFSFPAYAIIGGSFLLLAVGTKLLFAS